MTGLKGCWNFLLPAALLVLASTGARAQSEVYRWVDDSGVVHFSDELPEDGSGSSAETILIPDSGTPFSTVAPAAAPADQQEESSEIGFMAAQALSSTATASRSTEECGAVSPSVISGQDLYDLDSERQLLTRNEMEVVRSVIRRMRGRWTGVDTGFSCNDEAGEGIKEPLDRSIVAEGDFNPPDRFVLESTIRSQGSNFREQLRINIREGVFRVNQGNAKLIDLSESGLAFSYKLRVGGIVSEFYWRVELGLARALTIELLTYSNGALSSFSVWELGQPF